MADSELFECHDVTEHAQAIAKFLPGGRLFEAAFIPDTIYNMFLRGLGRTNQDVEDLLKLFDDELDINTTTCFLEAWEETVGIPDECFDTNVDIQTRRQQVLIKLASLGVQTEEDFEELAALYGVEIEIIAGSDAGVFTYTFPILLFSSATTARFTMVVVYEVAEANTFTYTFPIIFGDAAIPILECLFRKLAPANVDVLFRQVDQVDPFQPTAFSSGFDDGFE